MKRDSTVQVASAAFLIAALGAGGCNPDAYSYYVTQHYGSVRGEMFEFGGEEFAVLDKPQENRMLVAHGSNVYTMEEWARVAAAFLKARERNCDVANANQVTLRQIEIYYLCG